MVLLGGDNFADTGGSCGVIFWPEMSLRLSFARLNQGQLTSVLSLQNMTKPHC